MERYVGLEEINTKNILLIWNGETHCKLVLMLRNKLHDSPSLRLRAWLMPNKCFHTAEPGPVIPGEVGHILPPRCWKVPVKIRTLAQTKCAE